MISTHPKSKIITKAEEYLKYAQEINAVAKMALKLENPPAKAEISTKISIGLSLQAVELVGKGILMALGLSDNEIRKKHARHNIYNLLKHVESELSSNPHPLLIQYHGFMRTYIIFDGDTRGNTIGQFFKEFDARGLAAAPRYYFYPDLKKFTASNPIQGTYYVAEQLIGIAFNIISVIEYNEHT